MWSRRHLVSTVVFLCVLGIVFFQLRSEGYTTRFLYGSQRSSRLHFLIPASKPHLQLCRAILSSAALGYPPATMPGWNGEGELDAAVTHLAKVRNIARYFDSLPPTDDDDLVLIIDGYDVILQLPPEIMIQRYFAVTEAANAKLAARFSHTGNTENEENMTARSGAATGDTPRLSVLFGPDKLCWPEDFRRPACWAVPQTSLPDGVFGWGDEMEQRQPRWLNSGTIMGPVGDLRRVFNATMERIRTTYDPEYICRESDQMYMSDVWGEQEYGRLLLESPADYTPADGFQPEEGDRWVPDLTPGQQTEFRIGLDYESALFQPWAGYENFLDLLTFNGTDPDSASTSLFATVTSSVTDAPFDIQLPDEVASSLTRLLRAVSQSSSTAAADLLGTVTLGTNLVTRHVYGLFHCTGEKSYLEELWTMMWFFPYTRALVKAAADSLRAGAALSAKPIDGRQWGGATVYPPLDTTPDGTELAEEVAAGAWADLTNTWASWAELCGEYDAVLFGEQPIAPGEKDPESIGNEKDEEVRGSAGNYA